MGYTEWILAIVGLFVAYRIVRFALKPSTKAAKAAASDIPIVTLQGAFSHSANEESAFARVMAQLDEIETLAPKAMVLQINSPGSTTGAAHELHARMTALRERGIKIVAMMQDVCASGGVYAAMAADHIVASPATITGSIGVIMQSYDVSALLPHLKLGVRIIKSGPMKDILSPTRAMTEEEHAMLQSMITDSYKQFCEVVADGRGMPVEKVREFADGRVFTGRQAMALGLVDELGSLATAVDAAAELAGIPKATRRAKPLKTKKSFSLQLRKLLPGARLEERALDILPRAEFSGMPLYMMTKF